MLFEVNFEVRVLGWQKVGIEKFVGFEMLRISMDEKQSYTGWSGEGMVEFNEAFFAELCMECVVRNGNLFFAETCFVELRLHLNPQARR